MSERTHHHGTHVPSNSVQNNATSICRGCTSFLPQPPLNSIHPALCLTSSQSLLLPAAGCPGSAPLFNLLPLKVPPHPPHGLRDGASKEQSRPMNFPLFFSALKTVRLPSNFCGTIREGAHYVKHTFSSLLKLRRLLLRAFQRLHVILGY